MIQIDYGIPSIPIRIIGAGRYRKCVTLPKLNDGEKNPPRWKNANT